VWLASSASTGGYLTFMKMCYCLPEGHMEEEL
jgi:hypothetical protein